MKNYTSAVSWRISSKLVFCDTCSCICLYVFGRGDVSPERGRCLFLCLMCFSFFFLFDMEVRAQGRFRRRISLPQRSTLLLACVSLVCVHVCFCFDPQNIFSRLCVTYVCSRVCLMLFSSPNGLYKHDASSKVERGKSAPITSVPMAGYD